MSRFASLIGFEVRFYLGRLSTWIYLLVLAGIAFLMANLLGGAFPQAQAGVGGSDGKVLVNSPFVIALLTASVNTLFHRPTRLGAASHLPLHPALRRVCSYPEKGRRIRLRSRTTRVVPTISSQ